MKNEKVRVNISIPRETHMKLKRIAEIKETNVSRLITELASRLGNPLQGGVARPWLEKIPSSTLERVEQFAYEHHTTPEQAITDWAWSVKVANSTIRGQISLF